MPGTIKTWHELPLLPHDDGRHVRRAEGVSSALSLARYQAPELTLMPSAGRPLVKWFALIRYCSGRPRITCSRVPGRFCRLWISPADSYGDWRGWRFGPGTHNGRARGGPGRVADGLGGDAVVGGRGVGCGHFSGDRGGLEALDDQPDAELELPGSYREGRDRPKRGDMPDVAAEQRGDYGGDEQRGSDEAEHGNDAGHEPGPVHQRAEQQGV